MNKYTAHEIANIFPLMQESEYESLKADIKINGLIEPVWLYENKILDGRNRYNACQSLGLDIIPREYTGDDPLSFVVSLNKERRHLTASQLATVAVEILPFYEAEAKKRQIASGRLAGKNEDGDPIVQVVEKIPQPENNSNNERARDFAADKVGVNPHYVSDAKKLKNENPKVYAEIKNGKKTITQAKREIKEEKREATRQKNREKITGQTVPIEQLDVQFPTIVIDPPWDWGDEGDNDQFGRAKPDYHTLSLAELFELPLEKLSMPDAHLYLWITNRSLPKGFELLDKWGFRYITCLTWVKPTYGLGNYFRGQTEHILFGVKGSLALKRKDVGTVLMAPRGSNGHSSKPVEFYNLVESCSHGPYLEMFSRVNREGWTAWGENVSAFTNQSSKYSLLMLKSTNSSHQSQ